MSDSVAGFAKVKQGRSLRKEPIAYYRASDKHKRQMEEKAKTVPLWAYL